MTPTQAQIKAAAKAIMKTTYPSAEAQAEAALTAAAEVGETKRDPLNEIQERYQKSAESQFTASVEAAQSPGIPMTTEARHSIDIDATIERCAQVADEAGEGEGEKIKAICRWIADRIRALKDKP